MLIPIKRSDLPVGQGLQSPRTPAYQGLGEKAGLPAPQLPADATNRFQRLMTEGWPGYQFRSRLHARLTGSVRAMPDFIFQANIAHYHELLATETDARKIIMIRKLLADEEAKLAEWRAKNQGPKERKRRRR